MAFNHCAKMKRILADYDNWYIVHINQPTTAKNFKGETRQFDHYYRAMTSDGQAIKFCKFQQLDRFTQTMDISAASLPITEVNEEPRQKRPDTL